MVAVILATDGLKRITDAHTTEVLQRNRVVGDQYSLNTRGKILIILRTIIF